jgi:hypothetical protein
MIISLAWHGTFCGWVVTDTVSSRFVSDGEVLTVLLGCDE